jgi:hypothetical protein
LGLAKENVHRPRTAISFSSKEKGEFVDDFHTQIWEKKEKKEILNSFFCIEHIFGLKAVLNVSVLSLVVQFVGMRYV